ncbi:MAG: SMI1/KNR4 family protein, partial [Candidatus Gracilibacteria bacterium]|nr:SMI1/KNR4 family protein [Candidatus Gracilibacteria bacterium]
MKKDIIIEQDGFYEINYNPSDFEKLSNQERLEKLESNYEVELPEKYREYLQNGNEMAMGDIYVGGDQIFAEVWGLYPLYNIGSNKSIYPNFIFLDRLEGTLRVPKGYFCIGSGGGGRVVINLLNGPDHGKIYYWSQGLEQEEATMENTFYVADNFEEFLNGVGDYFYDDADIEYHEIISKYEEKEDVRLYRLIQKLSTKTLSREYKNIEPELQKVVDIIAANEDEDLE